MFITADAHCDTMTEALDKNEKFYGNTCHIDLARINKTQRHLQFFAAFIEPGKYKGTEIHRFMQALDYFYNQVDEYKDLITICKNFDDINHTLDSCKTAAIISIENGGALQGDISALRIFYRLGVRSICLTWNFANEIADGILDSAQNRGLTVFGREVVGEMNRLGMIVDVSHLSVKSFWDVIETSKSPIIASHSNAISLCKHVRNLSDDQINAIKENGGMIGINLCPDFLNDSGIASIDDIVRHIEYIVSLTGEDHIGLGADFDGVESLPEGISGLMDMDKLYNKLLTLNYKQAFIEKFAGGNLLRVLKQVLL